MIPPSLLIMNRRVIFTDYHCMDNIQSVHKGLHLYLVILFLLVVSRILVINFMLMSVKIRRYRAIIIIIINFTTQDFNRHMQLRPFHFDIQINVSP